MTAMKRVPIHKKAADVTVTFDPEPISYEALDNRLRIMRQQSASVHALITDSWLGLEREYKGGPINVLMSELSTLEGLLESALKHAESVSDQIKRETA